MKTMQTQLTLDALEQALWAGGKREAERRYSSRRSWQPIFVYPVLREII